VTLTIPKNGTYSTEGTNSAASDVNGTNGTLKLHPAEYESMSLLPVEVVELSPKTKDEDGNPIAGSEKPNSGKPLTPFVEENPKDNKIAHRELKVLIGSSMKDKKVTWTLEPVPGATPATIRGKWSDSPVTAHKNCFEKSDTYGENEFTIVPGSGTGKDAKAETTVGADGHTAIRVNVPPIGFNQVRIKIQIEGMSTSIDLIDMEVPGVVVIDPGHGGYDSGAVGAGGVKEKDLALAYSLSLRQKLIDKFASEKQGLRVVMTRKTTEEFPSKPARPERAKNTGADIFVSIHFNSAAPSARGTEVLIERTLEESIATGDPVENPGANLNVDEDAGLASTLSATTFKAVQASDPGAIQRALLRNGKVVNRDIYNGNSEGYTPVRACLIEVEFLSHPTALETVRLSNPSGVAIKQKFADDVAVDIFNNIRNQP
jgi:N-acetylmuramoyl-L-alanine amidase